MLGELTPALRAPQATTKRDFGAAGSLNAPKGPGGRAVAALSGQLSLIFTVTRAVCVER